MDVGERVLANSKLESVKEQEVALEAQLKQAESDFAASWNTYGSELAGRDPEIDRISEQLSAIRRDRLILELALAGNPDAASEEAVMVEKLRVAEQIEVLRQRQQTLSDSLETSTRLRELLYF